MTLFLNEQLAYTPPMAPDNDDAPEPWRDLTYYLPLTDARIVATLGHDGGAIVETAKRLKCYETRRQSFHTANGKSVCELEYRFCFELDEEEPPEASQGAPARIVITGTHQNGLRLEIRGDGWIGYDDQGRVEGEFETPPVIIREDHELDDDDEDEDAMRRVFPNFEMPPQYKRANIRVPSPDDDWPV